MMKLVAKRRYELKKRAAGVAETRRRITAAAVELHQTVGPAATQISEVARRAGVQRVTVYAHFPDEAALLTACSAHWRALHPAPDPNQWRATSDAGERLRLGLGALYGWYRETEPMTANVLRDVSTVPALRPIVGRGLGAYLDRVRLTLVEPFAVRGRRRLRVELAVAAATDFHVWRALSGLGDNESANLGAALVELVANG